MSTLINTIISAVGIVVSLCSIWVAWISMTEANRITKYEKQKLIYDVCRNLMESVIQLDNRQIHRLEFDRLKIAYLTEISAALFS